MASSSNSNNSPNHDEELAGGSGALMIMSTMPKTTAATIFRWPSRRRITLRRRRRVIPTVRLGGRKKPAGRRGFSLVRIMLRRIRLRWMKMKNSCTLKKLRDYYHSVVKDIIEGGGTIEAFHHRLLMETSFAIPVMGLSLNSFSPSSHR